ncbi:MAG: hypothetical protein SFU84_15015 [Gemmatimonadales bacterium]|nr:hypothetical protein [Gemmatimonadales bacterium]
MLAYDWQQRRFSLFSASGQHVRDWNFKPPEGVVGATPQALLPDGGLLLTIRRTKTFPFEGREGEVRPDSVELLAVKANGVVAWRGRIVRAGAVFGFGYTIGKERHLAGAELPFASNAEWRIGQSGVVVSEGTRAALKLIGPDGSVRELSVAVPAPVAVTPAMREALSSRFTHCARGSGDAVDAELGRAIRALRTPTVLPPIGRLLRDGQGGIWVSQGSTAGYPAVCGLPLPDERRWMLLNAAGGIAAAIDLPVSMRLTDIGGDRLVGLVVDDDDVVHVRIYSVSAR